MTLQEPRVSAKLCRFLRSALPDYNYYNYCDYYCTGNSNSKSNSNSNSNSDSDDDDEFFSIDLLIPFERPHLKQDFNAKGPH